MEHQDVHDDGALARALAREEIEGAHPEAERQDHHRRRDDEEDLLVEPELRLTHPADKDERQGHGEGEADGLGRQQPHGLGAERWRRGVCDRFLRCDACHAV